ncbi:MAG: AAA family ATPase [Nitrospina sp.]|jgi:hypothetical protein|nr:AAA family ATPase [Nitrospina sp.]
MNTSELCSGHGQWWSPKNTTNPQAYITVTLDEIYEMAKTPTSVAKENAQWVIGSSLLSRVHAEQKEKGQFNLQWADLDDVAGLTFDEIVNRALDVLPCDFIAYTSRSATEKQQKARLIIPLSAPVSGKQFVIQQTILNNRLESVGVTPDRATQRAGQVCFLPNRGEFYRSQKKNTYGPFDPTQWGEDIARIEVEQEAEREALEAQNEAARIKASQRMASGEHDPLKAYNEAYGIPLTLSIFGYVQRGKRWLSPNSSSGVPGVTITADGQKWLSCHESDASIGKPTKNGTMGDAFDLFVNYSHGGDYTAALKAAGEMFTTDVGVSLNKANQCDYMEKTKANFDDVSKPQQLGLSKFALNGQSAAMEEKMLDDVFILGRIALLGQSTVIYAKPGVGKTLLTLWLLIEAVKEALINGNDVFFVNADDNHKGLTHKLKLAEHHKFHMLAPGYNEFKSEMLTGAIKQMIETSSARGKILILDTVKKFTDIMRKDKASEFGEIVRQFVSHGGSVVMLAHTNKHRGEDGKVIFSGTSDLVDDVDCAYTLDIVTEDKFDGPRTVKFENFKNRGDVANMVVYKYDCSPSLTYQERLDSVRIMSDIEREKAEQQNVLEKKYWANKDAVVAIRQILGFESMTKTELIKRAMEYSGIGRRKILKTLNDHTGENEIDFEFWTVKRTEKNSSIFTLNHPV